MACRTVLDIRHRAFDQVLRLPLGYFHRGGGAEASSRLIQDAFALQEGIQTLFGKVVTEPLQAAAMLLLAIILALQIDARILLIALFIGPAMAILIRKFASRMRRATKKQLQSAARILDILQESLAGLRVVKAYTMEGRERLRFFREGREFVKQSMKAFKTNAASGPALELLATLAMALAVVLGAYWLDTGGLAREVDPSTMLAFFGALVATLDPMRKLADVNNRIQMAINGAERLFEVIDTPSEVRHGGRGIVLPRMARDIVFENTRFRYESDMQEVLQDVSLRVRAGETIAVVGRTGCGKTTLVNLIPRFFVPQSGRVLIDGHDIQDVTLRSLRDQIGLVSQETILFKDSIANNIAYGSRPAVRQRGGAGRVSRAEIVAAARMAHADEFIVQLPQGYDTVIGTLGQTLSGGQRQRLALARAIIRDPAILILDEATSALDEETQALVQDTLEHFVRGRTVFIIAHRLSTIALAERIVVMEAGRIVDIGRHDELLARCDVYRRLRESGFESG